MWIEEMCMDMWMWIEKIERRMWIEEMERIDVDREDGENGSG